MAAHTFLICRLGARRIALPVAAVAQVLPMLPLARPPTLPRPLAGFAMVAGRAAPVLDPLPLFGDAPATVIDLESHLLRLRGAAAIELFLLVRRAEDVVHADDGDLLPVDAEHSRLGFVIGTIDLAEGAAHVIAIDRLLDAAERRRVEAIAADASARAALWAEPA